MELKDATTTKGTGTVPESRQSLDSGLVPGSADWQAHMRSAMNISSMSLLHPALSAIYGDASQAKNAQMLDGLAWAASLQQSIEARQQSQSQATQIRPTPQRPVFHDRARLEVGSLPNCLKRDLTEEEETPAARKRSKSEDNLSSMDDQNSQSLPSPQAGGKRLGSNASRLSAIREQEQRASDLNERDDEDFGRPEDDLDGIQDDKEIKRIRRKQSNRESARRSRLRKQRESEALSSSVAGLRKENQQLRETNKRLQAKIDELSDQIAQESFGKDASPRSTLAQKLSAFQVVQRKTSDASKSTDSQTQALNPSFGLVPSPLPALDILKKNDAK